MSGGAGDGYSADPEALAEVAKGLNGVIAELKDVTGQIGYSDVGRGFEELQLTGLQLGSAGLTAAFGTFCERWEWGVRELVGEATQFAEGLNLSAGIYNDMEQYAKDTLKVGVNAAIGNPHLTEEQAASMSRDQVVADMKSSLSPDYSGQSFQESARTVDQTWKETARDSLTGGTQNEALLRAFGVSDEELDAAKDQAFGSES